MLEQLGSEEAAELECGSHVSRLQGKLHHELQISFGSEFLPFSTLLTGQSTSIRSKMTPRNQSCIHAPSLPTRKREGRHDTKPPGRFTSILLGAVRPTADSDCRVPATGPARSGTERSHVPTVLIVTILVTCLMDAPTSRSCLKNRKRHGSARTTGVGGVAAIIMHPDAR